MEIAGTIFEGEWDSSFNAMCSEESDFMARLLGNGSIPNAAFWPGNGNGNDEMNNSSMFSFLNNNGFCMLDCKSNVMEGDDFLNAEELPQSLQEDQITSSKKRPRVLGESQRSKRLKNCAKIDEDENYDSKNATTTKVVLHRRSSSLCCLEDGVNSSSRGKTRASRGSATDPQSLYARKRRERINERLKILQNLVPNGTKVDLSTMLEEAVQYVKFLQLQIKLLSSEDMWMYAPIAYNGMDIGLDFKIPSTKPQS